MTSTAAGDRTGCTPPPAPVVGVNLVRRRLRVQGVVQGVGFRPFVWTLATRLGLRGSVRNTSGAVVIEIEGGADTVEQFAGTMVAEAPPLARIERVDIDPIEPTGDTGFHIEPSSGVAGEYQPVAPDAGTCVDCLLELTTPGDRRFGYPFINCTNCGPRFTIIEDVPYDRPLTTMRKFRMCSRCQAEYDDPADRRFHAQPNACSSCGPRAWFATAAGKEQAGDPIVAAAATLRNGGIVAVKGLGGFQLACLATDQPAVERLRTRKRRPSKAFAVMVADVDAARLIGRVSAAEATLLQSPARPVVLLRRRRAAGDVCEGVAPGLREVGVMLPATPLHHLLLAAAGTPLVMTSGNLTEEPIARENAEAVERLGTIADAFLLHDRDIYARYDDSVVRVAAGAPRTVRRARGYSPLPIAVAGADLTVLALGAHLKNTFCVLREGRAFVGPHLGDLDHPLTLQHQAEALATYLRLFRATPTVVACDLHPDYASTRLAEQWWDAGARAVKVQHHHAHIASVMAEHRLRGPLLGVAFDGAGLGVDGTVWGGELLVCDEFSSRRVGHLAPVPQPGGDRCAREGWRMVAACLAATGAVPSAPPPWLHGGPDARSWRLVARLSRSSTVPITSSAGRIFDAAASVLGGGHTSSYEGEAAMRVEALAAGWIDDAPPGALSSPGSPVLPPIEIASREGELVLCTPMLVRALIDGLRRGVPAGELAAAFHEQLSQALVIACAELAQRLGLRRVALSGGAFQNVLLLERTTALLRDRGLEVYTNCAVPANDGGISLGQALVAAALVGDGGRAR